MGSRVSSAVVAVEHGTRLSKYSAARTVTVNARLATISTGSYSDRPCELNKIKPNGLTSCTEPLRAPINLQETTFRVGRCSTSFSQQQWLSQVSVSPSSSSTSPSDTSSPSSSRQGSSTAASSQKVCTLLPRAVLSKPYSLLLANPPAPRYSRGQPQHRTQGYHRDGPRWTCLAARSGLHPR